MLNVKSHTWLVITGPNSAMLSDSLCSGSKTWVEQHGSSDWGLKLWEESSRVGRKGNSFLMLT